VITSGKPFDATLAGSAVETWAAMGVRAAMGVGGDGGQVLPFASDALITRVMRDADKLVALAIADWV
jgi:hypothetical protein